MNNIYKQTLSKNMNKQKRISLPSASRPILSLRSTRMRNIQPTNANYNFWGTTISFIPSSSVPINRLDYTKEQLTQFIIDNGQDYCNAIMGVSCGDGGPSYGEWKQLSPYWKWYVAGGKCPKSWENISPNCTKGCLSVFGCA
jgi:hypothetical protein